jgi:hypothetical protein
MQAHDAMMDDDVCGWEASATSALESEHDFTAAPIMADSKLTQFLKAGGTRIINRKQNTEKEPNHVFMDSGVTARTFGGRVKVELKDLPDMRKAIAEDIKNHVYNCLVERFPPIARLAIDFDFKTELPLDDASKLACSKTAQAAVRQALDGDDEHHRAIVCAVHGEPRKAGDLFKDGLHQTWPSLYVTHPQAKHLLSKVVLPAMQREHDGINWPAVLDDSIYHEGKGLRPVYAVKRESCHQCMDRRRLKQPVGKDCVDCGGALVKKGTDHVYKPFAVLDADGNELGDHLKKLQDDAFLALTVASVIPSEEQTETSFKFEHEDDSRKRKAASYSLGPKKQHMARTVGPGVTHTLTVAPPTLTTEQVTAIYKEAGGQHDLQEMPSGGWRELSPGHDERSCLCPECDGVKHSDNALIMQTSYGLLYTCCSTKHKLYLQTHRRMTASSPEMTKLAELFMQAPVCVTAEPEARDRLCRLLKSHLDGKRDAEMCDIWHTFCARAVGYDADSAQLAWDSMCTEKMAPDEVEQQSMNLIYQWRIQHDLQFDGKFVKFVFINCVKPCRTAVIEAYKESEAVLKQIQRSSTKAEVEKIHDQWRHAMSVCMDQTLKEMDILTGRKYAKKTEDRECPSGILDYLNTFFVRVTDSATSEVVQIEWQPSVVAGGSVAHVIGGFKRRLTKQWIDEYKSATGFTLNPRQVYSKTDTSLSSNLGMPEFNTFCGLAINRHISAEDASTFKYDPEIVKRFTDFVGVLCNNSESDCTRLQQWIAAPLQKSGILTRQMVIMRSDLKGVGKGLLWNHFIGGMIYGNVDDHRPHFKCAYRQVKDIDHVVGHFNEGLLGKIFLNLDECGIFDGATKQNEKLKGLITEGTAEVNQKHMSLIIFTNYINMVLTSNKKNPIKMEDGDRRFHELVCKTKLPKEQFCGPDGLVAFFSKIETAVHVYSYLMQLDMGNFYTTDPPMTDAKAASIGDGLSVDRKFLQALCMRLQDIMTGPITEKSASDDADLELKVRSHKHSEIAVKTFFLHKQAFAAAFDQYQKEYDRRSTVTVEQVYATLGGVFEKGRSSKQTVHMQGFGTCRPLVMPCLTEMEAVLRAKGWWNDNFNAHMQPMPPMPGLFNEHLDLYNGQAIKPTGKQSKLSHC